MENFQENKPLLYSLFFSSAAILCLASGIMPDVSKQFELVDLDSEVSDLFIHHVLMINFGFNIEVLCQKI